MKAIVRDTFGSPNVLRLEDIPKPTIKPNQVLIQVKAVGLNAADKVLLRGEPFLARTAAGGLIRPGIKVLGAAVAGVIDAIGSEVVKFAVGDEVLVDTSGQGFGGLAEYTVSTEEFLARKPHGVSFIDAAALPMATTTAVQSLRDRKPVEPGMRVLVVGASGGVGSFAVQLAKHFGAHVTAVCSTRNVEIVRGIGADVVVDYKKDDVTQGADKFDVIVDTACYRSVADYVSIMNDNAQYLLIGGEGFVSKMLHMAWLSATTNMKFSPFLDRVNAADLELMCELVESGEIKPLIDTVYPFSEGISAMEHIDSGHTQGKVIVEL